LSNMAQRQMKICFVAQHIYPYLSKSINAKTAGGAELQQVYIGKSLARKGYDISYVSLDYGQPDGEILDGVTIYKTFRPKQGIFGFRWLYPRLYNLWRALKKADADVYYARCATFIPGILALFCSKYKKKFVYAGAHVTDFIPDKIRIPIKRDRLLYLYGLQRADQIIVQSLEQKKLLRDNFKLPSKVIRNFSPLSDVELPLARRRFILWVSTIREWKRPFQYLRLAQNCPEETFVMIGGKSFGKGKLYASVEQVAAEIDNLMFLGYQPFDIAEEYFDQAKIFINTSEYEGFPNTFLQAWRRGIPVISYVDPDNIVDKNNLGSIIDSEEQLMPALDNILKNMNGSTEHIRQYFQRNHSIATIEKYMTTFDALGADGQVSA